VVGQDGISLSGEFPGKESDGVSIISTDALTRFLVGLAGGVGAYSLAFVRFRFASRVTAGVLFKWRSFGAGPNTSSFGDGCAAHPNWKRSLWVIYFST